MHYEWLLWSNFFHFFRINVKDHSLDISFEEWRDYLLFHPSADLADIIASWRHNTVRYKRMDFLSHAVRKSQILYEKKSILCCVEFLIKIMIYGTKIQIIQVIFP